MLNCFQKRPVIMNNINISEYLKKSTNESIKKISDKFTLERNSNKDNENNNNKLTITFYEVLWFLSISTLAMYIYKRIK
jgi:hypothetical protein